MINKKKSLHIIIVFFIIGSIMMLFTKIIIKNKSYMKKEDSCNMIKVMGILAPYKCFDREVYDDYFRSLKKGTSLKNIINDVGEPNGWFGSGIVRPYYEVEDDKLVVLSLDYTNQNEIINILICPKNYNSYDDVDEIKIKNLCVETILLVSEHRFFDFYSLNNTS